MDHLKDIDLEAITRAMQNFAAEQCAADRSSSLRPG
jgi:hypothetical protein